MYFVPQALHHFNQTERRKCEEKKNFENWRAQEHKYKTNWGKCRGISFFCIEWFFILLLQLLHCCIISKSPSSFCKSFLRKTKRAKKAERNLQKSIAKDKVSFGFRFVCVLWRMSLFRQRKSCKHQWWRRSRSRSKAPSKAKRQTLGRDETGTDNIKYHIVKLFKVEIPIGARKCIPKSLASVWRLSLFPFLIVITETTVGIDFVYLLSVNNSVNWFVSVTLTLCMLSLRAVKRNFFSSFSCRTWAEEYFRKQQSKAYNKMWPKSNANSFVSEISANN